jgi:hypothetical protein
VAAFNRKEWLEDLKPARRDEASEDRPEAFDVFQVASAWVLKHCARVPREEKEALQEATVAGQDAFASPRRQETPPRDAMLVQLDEWRAEDLRKAKEEFIARLTKLEEKYATFIWLLDVDVVRQFMRSAPGSLATMPR